MIITITVHNSNLHILLKFSIIVSDGAAAAAQQLPSG